MKLDDKRRIMSTGNDVSFWGVKLEFGVKLSQTVENSFRVSMATLAEDPSTKDPDACLSLWVTKTNKTDILLCTLHPKRQIQQILDIVFQRGETMQLFTKGKGTMFLSGYMTPEVDQYPNDSYLISSANDSKSASSTPAKKKSSKNTSLKGNLDKSDTDKKKATPKKAQKSPVVAKKKTAAKEKESSEEEELEDDEENSNSDEEDDDELDTDEEGSDDEVDEAEVPDDEVDEAEVPDIESKTKRKAAEIPKSHAKKRKT